MALRVQVLMTRYPHWGSYSRLRHLRYLDPERIKVMEHFSSDGNDDFPWGGSRVRQALLRRVQRGGMKWYKLSDLVGETKALGRSLSRRIDLVHYLDGEHGAQYLPLVSGHIRPPVAATYHQPASLLPSLVRTDVVRRLDHVTLVSPEQAPFFEALLPADRVSVILHGIDTEFFCPPEDRVARDELVCITVGHWLRDYEAFRKVARRCRERAGVVFRVVSPGVEGLGSLENVELFSGLSDEELRRLYQESDVLFLPLTDCTANNALLEAIACGLPVVSTDLPSIRAYLPGGEGILIEDNDEMGLTEAIESLQKDPEMRGRMGRAARTRAEELSWPKVARQYESLYRSVARGGDLC